MAQYTRRSVLAGIGAGIAIGAGAGVGGASSHGEREDAVRIVHLSPDVPTVDVYANGGLAFEDVDPLTQSGYVSYEPRSYALSFTPAGERLEEAIFETDVRLDSGEYTLAAIGEACSMSERPLELVRFEDENGPTEPGHARLRVVHASPDASAIDVATDDGTVLAEGLEFGEGVYVDVPADEEIIETREAGEENELARFALDLETGSVYTAYAVGYLAPEEAPDDLSFSLAITEDATPGEQ